MSLSLSIFLSLPFSLSGCMCVMRGGGGGEMLVKEEEEVINSKIMESSDDLTRVWLTFFLLLAAGVKSLAVGREVVKLCVQVPHCTAGQCQDTGDVKGKPHLWEPKRLDPVQRQDNMSKENPISGNPKDLIL